MKKLILLLPALCAAILTYATGGPVLLGGMFADGADTSGTVIQYIGGASSISTVYNLPYDFGAGGPNYVNLTEAPSGLLYGLNPGGAHSMGCIYQYDYTTNTGTIMASFDSTNGSSPQGALMLASNGKLYGMTNAGGAHNSGVIFSYVPGSSTITPLASLPVLANPAGALVQASNGILYGMTIGDGTNGSGTIFSYNISTNTYGVVYDMPLSAFANGKMIEVGADTLYGLTNSDGANNGGTIFRFVTASAAYTPLHSLPAHANPNSWMVHATDGKLYGLTTMDGANFAGTIFSYDLATSTYTDEYDFGSTPNDGTMPTGGIMQASDGNLYGMTNSGGIYTTGTIFQFNLTGPVYNKYVDLDAATGDMPGSGSLTEYLSPTGSGPTIVSQPSNATTCPGSTATFMVATGGTATSIQWQYSSGGAYTNISGATDSVYTFTPALADNGYTYRAVLSNAGGSDTTQSASLILIILNDSATVSGPVCTASGNGATYQWFSCSSGQAVTGATSASYTATANGSYFCVVALSGCTDTTACVSVTDAGIADLSAYSFSLYPDPTSGTFMIENNYTGSATVEVLSMVGDRLKTFGMSGSRGQYDISDLASGIYQIVISDSHQTLKVMKVVKD